jgi:heme/copper-type cytochrome/quinol oxidase subunit 1
VHMPEPSMLPIANAVGVTLSIVGLTLELAVTIVGLVIFLVTLIAWMRSAAHEMSELPLDHSSH